MKYTCPVCGYDSLETPPLDFSICPSCGTEFGNDDFEFSHEELRQRWINDGLQWWSAIDPIPQNWNPFAQLRHVMSDKVSTGTTNSKNLVADRHRFWNIDERSWSVPVQLVGSAQVSYSYATLQG